MRIVFHLVTGPDDVVEYQPLGFGYLASYLQENGVEARCSVEDNLDSILAIAPDIVAFSCCSQNYRLAIERVGFLRQRMKAVFLLGGVHISSLPDSLHRDFACGVVGEGEETFLQLINLLAAHGELAPASLSRVQGLVYWDGDEIRRTPDRELLDLLDDLPPPDRSILPPAKFAHLLTGRGCPYDCSFCSSRLMWGGYRGFSAERVGAELAALVTEGHTQIHIHDDLFVADRPRLVRLADVLEEAEVLGAAELSCTVRADLVDEDLAEMLVRLNVTSVTFGMESADDETQARLCKRTNIKQVRNALAVLDRFGIEATVSAIVGEPDETILSMRKTYSFLCRQVMRGRLAGAEVNVLAPYPGTGYWQTAVERGLIGDPATFDWSKLGAPWRGLLLNPHLEADAARLVAWDRHLRALMAALRRSLIMIAPDDADLDLDLDPALVRAIFLWTAEDGLSEVLAQDEIDLVRFGPDRLWAQLEKIVADYGEAPLLLIAPEPDKATSAVMRALKAGLGLEKQKAVQSRVGPFPLLAVMAEAVSWGPDRVAALMKGDTEALPEELPVAQPTLLRELPLADFNQSVAYEGEVSDLLDEYTRRLPKGPK